MGSAFDWQQGRIQLHSREAVTFLNFIFILNFTLSNLKPPVIKSCYTFAWKLLSAPSHPSGAMPFSCVNVRGCYSLGWYKHPSEMLHSMHRTVPCLCRKNPGPTCPSLHLHSKVPAQETQEGSVGQQCQTSWAIHEGAMVTCNWLLQFWEFHSAKVVSFVQGCLPAVAK